MEEKKKAYPSKERSFNAQNSFSKVLITSGRARNFCFWGGGEEGMIYYYFLINFTTRNIN